MTGKITMRQTQAYVALDSHRKGRKSFVVLPFVIKTSLWPALSHFESPVTLLSYRRETTCFHIYLDFSTFFVSSEFLSVAFQTYHKSIFNMGIAECNTTVEHLSGKPQHI